ncbi:hypothetical protein BpJC7_09080 [Weizmannia acidilactici]|uniref:Protein GrpE n=1 Tax=Weizmannia acidilactici TaxID=2607726 RepID=A0A5J4JG65_9BACI|nr:nucleotide exchange factor GrpE [Weizmannia acidilactici]GER66951.1 hypothetical protein BpJC4_14220 [Weizmannia acidilactici]GER69605.1 hypothetical protein BpJC7_09080 [Weizmannia acidilactici]GER72718.1 hypothetical protein BpPP18_07850 [Weizmannia acidilactici]
MAEEQKKPSENAHEAAEEKIEAVFEEEKETEKPADTLKNGGAETKEGAPETKDAETEKAEAPKTEEEKAENASEAQPANEELEKAKQTIKELQNELEQAENRYLRLRADFENFRRRVNLDREAAEKYRAQELITNLLPAIDNFERALSMAEKNDHTKQLLDGMEMVYRSILEALKKEGAEPIEALGKEFDPHFHQAIMQGQEEDVASNVVLEEFQKGYMLKDRVIRPSMVKVNQ